MKDPLLYRIVRPILVGWFKLVYQPIFINKEAIPKQGRVLIAGTHVSKKDPILLAASTKRCIRNVAKDELFKNPITKFIFNGLGAIPVNRRIKDASVVPSCVKILKQDGLVSIMPEGTINRTDDIIMPFKTGVIRMSIESNSPIVPFAIIGKVTKNYKAFQKKIKIVFGEAYHPKTDDIDAETKVLEGKVIELLESNKER